MNNPEKLQALALTPLGVLLLIAGVIYVLSPLIIVMQLRRVQKLQERQIRELEQLNEAHQRESGRAAPASSVKYVV